MKIILVGLAFLICSSAYSAKQQRDFSSVTDKCAYAQQGIHIVQESSYSKLLATLRGEGEDIRYKKKRVKEGDSQGQR